MRLYVSKLHFYLILACDNKSLLSHPILREIATVKSKIMLFDKIYFKFKRVLVDLVKQAKIKSAIESGKKENKKGARTISKEDSDQSEDMDDRSSMEEEDYDSQESEDDEELTLEEKLKSYELKAKKNKANSDQKNSSSRLMTKGSGGGVGVNQKNVENRIKNKKPKAKDSFISLGITKQISKPKKSAGAEIEYSEDSSDDQEVLKLTQGLQK